MIRMPVSNHYRMISDVNITYNSFHTHPIKNILKIKCTMADMLPGLRKIILTLNSSEKKEEIVVNSSELSKWFFSLIKAKIFKTNKIGISAN